MIPSCPAKRLLCYAIQIADREFLLSVAPDGLSQWEDHTGRRRIRPTHHRYLELTALAGDVEAFRTLENEALEFTISVQLPANILEQAVLLAKKERKAPGSLPCSMRREIAKMDNLLTDFFWREINSLLAEPIKPLAL